MVVAAIYGKLLKVIHVRKTMEMNRILVLLVCLSGAVYSGLGSLQYQLLHPCLPSGPRGQNALQNGSHYTSTTPAQRQYGLQDIQLHMIEAARSISRMQKNIKRELRKKNKKFRATFMQYQKDIKAMVKKTKKSSLFKSLKTNLKIHYTAVSNVYTHLSQVPRRQGKTRRTRKWNRKLSQLQQKHLLILCRLKDIMLSERTSPPSIPKGSPAVFSEDSVRSRLDLYKQLTNFKLNFKWMIRLYKYYNSRRNIKTECKGHRTSYRKTPRRSTLKARTNPSSTRQ